MAVPVVMAGQLATAGPAAAEPGDVSASECLTGDAEVVARGGNQAYEAKRSDGGTATLVWEESTDEVVTMFTSDPGGGDWSACAELIDG